MFVRYIKWQVMVIYNVEYSLLPFNEMGHR